MYQIYKIVVTWKTSTRANAALHSNRWVVVAATSTEAFMKLKEAEPNYRVGLKHWSPPTVTVEALGQVREI